MRACGCCVWLRERGMVGDSTCRVLAKMPSLEKKTILSHFGARALFVCLWLVLCPVAIRWLLVARPMHVLASPVEPAHGL